MSSRIFILTEGKVDEHNLIDSIFKNYKYNIVYDNVCDDCLHYKNKSFDIYVKTSMNPQLISVIRKIYDDETLKYNNLSKVNMMLAANHIPSLYDITKIDFSHIFLLFDVDSNEKECIKLMAKLFDNSTENGLLVLSIPMLQGIVDEQILYNGSTKEYKKIIGNDWSLKVANGLDKYLNMNIDKFNNNEVDIKDHHSHLYNEIDKLLVSNEKYPVYNLLHILIFEMSMQDNVDDALKRLQDYNNLNE